MTYTVLGLDVSTSTIGYALLNVSDSGISLLSIDHYKPPKDGDLLDRLSKTQKHMKGVVKSLAPDYIGIENILEYMPNKSSSHSIIALAQVNRLIGVMCHDYLKRSPELFSVMAIRHGLKHTKVFPKKEQMPAVIEKHLGITLPPVLVSRGKNKGKFAPEHFDRADGLAVALYYALILTGKKPHETIRSL